MDELEHLTSFLIKNNVAIVQRIKERGIGVERLPRICKLLTPTHWQLQ